MKIVIAGGAGFLGRNLQVYFESLGHHVFVLTRFPKQKNDIYWDAKNIGDWENVLENAEVLINLTGKSVDCRYTQENKEEILSSRIQSTKVLQNAIDKRISPPKIWLNASSATIYIHSETHINSENDGITGDDFSMNICKSWEEEFFKSSNANTRKVALRTSIVFGNNGGAFPKLKKISKWGLGGKQGSGYQWVSWIHIKDFCEAVSFIINNHQIAGSINITAPQPVSNQELMQGVRQNLKIPFGLNAAVWQLELASIFLRTETELLLKSRFVYPQILLDKGFEFKYPTLETALSELL